MSVVKTLEESKQGKMKVQGDAIIIPGINEESGALVVLADICEWFGAGKPDVPPYLLSDNKKIGINVYPMTEDNQICTMVFVSDFFNSMM